MLRDEIVFYIDKFGLVAPHIADPTLRGSDNGPLYTSEYYILLGLLDQRDSQDVLAYQKVIGSCIDTELRRVPGDTAGDEPDDHIGVYAACRDMGLFELAPKLPVRLWRQPQLLFASLCARDKTNLLHTPLALYTALVVATSCIGRPTSDQDSRILCYLLILATHESLLVRVASKLWFNRLKKDYSDGIKTPITMSLSPGHPIGRYWPSQEK